MIMKNKNFKSAGILLSTVFLFFIIFMFAKTALGASSSVLLYFTNVPGYGDVASGNNLGLSVGFLYNVAMAVVGLVAFGSLVYAGILRTWGAVGNPGLIKEADERIKDTLWGIVLLAGAAVIFNTINPRLSDVGAIGKELGDLPVLISPTSTTYSSFADLVGETYSEDASRRQLSTYGIGTKTACAQGQTTGCVSLNGIQVDTMAEILSLGKAVGGNNVFVTGGTEGGHTPGQYDHGSGYKFDARPNPILDSYIKSNFTPAGTRSDGAVQYKAPSGAIYALEKDHWDVKVTPAGSTVGA